MPRLVDARQVEPVLGGLLGAVDVDVPVRLVTYPAGTDDDGVEAVAFGFAYDETTAPAQG